MHRRILHITRDLECFRKVGLGDNASYLFWDSNSVLLRSLYFLSLLDGFSGCLNISECSCLFSSHHLSGISRCVCPWSGYCLHMNEHTVAFHGSAVYEVCFLWLWGISFWFGVHVWILTALVYCLGDGVGVGQGDNKKQTTHGLTSFRQ